MPATPRSGGHPDRQRRAFVAFVAAVAIAAGCQSPTATSTPGVAPTASAGSVLTPKPSSQPSASSSAASSPSASVAASASAASGTWTSAGKMATARSGPQATLLGDGRVLVVGGDPSGEVTGQSAKVELWDPATGDWRTTESLNKARAEFALVTLADGRALVIGGRNQADQSYSSVYAFDPRPGKETWSKVGVLDTARTDPMAVVLADGRVLVAGGYRRSKPSEGAMPGARIVLAAYSPDDGGADGSERARLADVEPPNVGRALATAEIFDPTTGKSSPTGPMAFARFGAGAVRLDDGRVLVAGTSGSDGGVTVDDTAADNAEIYDPATGRFTSAGRLPGIDRQALEQQGAKGANPVPEEDPAPAANGALVASGAGDAVLIGHAGWWKHAGDITRSFRFDTASGRWSEIGQTWINVGEPEPVVLDTPGVRNLSGAMATGLPGGQVLVAGGGATSPNGSSSAAADQGAAAELYDPATDTWSALPPMPDARASGVAVTLGDGSAVLIGGYRELPDTTEYLASATRFVPGP